MTETSRPPGPVQALPWWVPAATFALAATLLTLVPLEVALDPGSAQVPDVGAPAYWLGLGLLAVQSLLLRLHSSWPLPVLVLVAALAPVAAVGLDDATGVTSVAVVVAAYRTVLSEERSRAVAGLLSAGLLVALGQAVAQHDASAPLAATIGSVLVQAVTTLGLAGLVGGIARSRRETVAAQQEQVQAVAREHAALVREAVARERTSMARELHDIAAHHLSGIAVMTGAIRRQIDTDPEGAKEAVQGLREQSTAMLRDMRGLVGMLRDDRQTPAEEVGPPASGEVREESLAGIEALVSAARDRGADVLLELHERADGRDLGAGIGPLAQLSAYRTVQEALANITRHAPGARTEVILDGGDPERLRIEIRNDRPGFAPARHDARAGFGLVGMRERAELTDARLRYGPTDDGGWFVSLSLPVPAPIPVEQR